MTLSGLYEFCTSSGLEVNLSKTEIMIYGRNKRKLNREAFYLEKVPVEITHKYKYLGIGFYSHGCFEPSNKRQRFASMKALMDTSREEAVVGVTCWELNSHSLKVLVLPTFKHGTKFGRLTWKTLIGRFSRRAWRCIWCLASKCILRLPIIFYWPSLHKLPQHYTLASSLHAFKNGSPTYPPLG